MRVMYMSHRYHTNQNAIVKGWKDHGDEVLFCSQYVGRIEDYTYIQPVVVGYSLLYRLFDKIYVKVLAKKNPAAVDLKVKCGFPPILKLAKIMRKFRPDIVIMRERSMYSICTNALCRFYHIPACLYVMNPVWGDAPKQDIAHKIVRRLTPAYRLTPSMIKGIEKEGKIEDKNAFYAPYLMEPQLSPEKKEYFQGGKINIFSIGKYEKRKNHLLMIQAVEILIKKYPNIHLNIAGEVSNDFHKEYYKSVKKYIEDHSLKEAVTLYTNLKQEKIWEEYKKADLFVLPSTGEPGAVSHLEAMAFSVPAIGGTDNGTASYIIPGETGYIFRDMEIGDLVQKIEWTVRDGENLKAMGKKAYEHVKKDFQFNKYYDSVKKVLKRYGKQPYNSGIG